MRRNVLIVLLCAYLCGCIPKAHFGPVYSAEGVFLDSDRATVLLSESRYQAVQELIPAPMSPLLDDRTTFAADLRLTASESEFKNIRPIDRINRADAGDIWKKDLPGYWPIPGTGRWMRTLQDKNNTWNQDVSLVEWKSAPFHLCSIREFNSRQSEDARAATPRNTHLLIVTQTSSTLFDLRDGTHLDDPATHPLCELLTVITRELGRAGFWSLSDDLRYVLVSPPAERDKNGTISTVGDPVPARVNGLELDLQRDAVVFDRLEKRMIRIDGGDRFHRPYAIGIESASPLILYGQATLGDFTPSFVADLNRGNPRDVHLSKGNLPDHFARPKCTWDPATHRIAALWGNFAYFRGGTPTIPNNRYSVSVYDYDSKATIMSHDFDSAEIQRIVSAPITRPASP